MFGEEGERLREDRASFLLGLAKGLQKKNVRSDGFLRILLKQNTALLSLCMYVSHRRDISTFFNYLEHENHII